MLQIIYVKEIFNYFTLFISPVTTDSKEKTDCSQL
jgi:hypothetical protein